MPFARNFPTWFPVSLRGYIWSALNPIETIAIPGSEHVIIIYRGYNNYYYDKKGKHRWGHASYDLYKGPRGWYSPGGGQVATIGPSVTRVTNFNYTGFIGLLPSTNRLPTNPPVTFP